VTALAVRWGVIVLFSLLVSGAFVLYGVVFTDIGHPPTEVVPLAKYFLQTLVHPLFVLGMVLALSGALVRMVMFSHVGIAETAMVSELTLVMSVVLAVLVFDSSPTTEDYLGMCLIMAGVYLVQSGGGAG